MVEDRRKSNEMSAFDNSLSLPQLIDRLTTRGKLPMDASLLQNFKQRLFASSELSNEARRLLFLQLKRPHSEIRLRCLHLLTLLTESSSTANVALQLRNETLLRLQEIIPLLLPTSVSDAPLPPPKEAATRLKLRTIELLLRWEREIKFGSFGPEKTSWVPTPSAKGQLSILLHYLRSANASIAVSPALREINKLVAKVESDQTAEEARRQRNCAIADAAFRRRMLEAYHAYSDAKEQIEENLTSLESLLKLLVPDPFEEFEISVTEEEPVVELISNEYNPREHGLIFGSSGGFGSSYASGGLSISLEVANVEDENVPLPRLGLKLTDETKMLYDTAQEFANVATHGHHSILSNYVQMAELCSSTHSLASAVAELPAAKASLLRLETSTSQFSDALFFEQTEQTDGDAPGVCSRDSGTDSDNFEEVPADYIGHSIATKNSEKKVLFTRTAVVTDFLPWETETALSVGRGKKFISSSSVSFRARKASNYRRSFDATKPSTSKAIGEDRSATDIFTLPSGSPSADDNVMFMKRRRADDTQHRFRKPIDVSKFELPETKQLKATISLSAAPKLFDNPLPTEPEVCARFLSPPASPPAADLVEKRKKRRRYSELQRVSVVSGTHSVRSRILHHRSLRKATDQLDTNDRKRSAKGFSNSYVHTFKR